MQTCEAAKWTLPFIKKSFDVYEKEDNAERGNESDVFLPQGAPLHPPWLFPHPHTHFFPRRTCGRDLLCSPFSPRKSTKRSSHLAAAVLAVARVNLCKEEGEVSVASIHCTRPASYMLRTLQYIWPAA